MEEKWKFNWEKDNVKEREKRGEFDEIEKLELME